MDKWRPILGAIHLDQSLDENLLNALIGTFACAVILLTGNTEECLAYKTKLQCGQECKNELRTYPWIPQK